MSVYKPTMRHLREVLLYYFNSSKSAYKAHQMLVHAYGKGIISQDTCDRYFRRFRSGDFNLNRYTTKLPNKERLIGELVRLRLEYPSMTQADMAAKFGVSRRTVYKYERSQEYLNKLKEKEQDQSSIHPVLHKRFKRRDFYLERLVSSALRRKRTVEELVRLKLEDPNMTRAEMAAKVGVSVSTVWNYQKSQEYQNELKKLQQDQSSIRPERTTLKRKHRELEEEESLNILDEIPPITNDETAIEHELSISKAEGLKKSVENKLESGSQPKKRPTSRTLCREWEDEELVRLLCENPGIPHSEIAKHLGMSKRIVSKRVRTQEIQSLLKDKRRIKNSDFISVRPTSRRSRREWEDGELVRLLYENPDIPHRELAIQLGISQTTLPTRINSPEIQNKLKERMQEESSIPKTLEHQSI